MDVRDIDDLCPALGTSEHLSAHLYSTSLVVPVTSTLLKTPDHSYPRCSDDLTFYFAVTEVISWNSLSVLLSISPLVNRAFFLPSFLLLVKHYRATI